MTLAVDRAAVEAEVLRRRAIRDSGFGRWILARLLASLAVFYGVAFVVRALVPGRSFVDMQGWHVTAFLVVPGVVAFVATAIAERLTFSDAALDPDRLCARIGKELGWLTAPGWPLRTLRAALLLALGVGVPAAFTVYATGRPTVLARPTDAAIAVFVSAVLLFSTATAFALRALTLYVYRPFVDARGDVIAPAPGTPG